MKSLSNKRTMTFLPAMASSVLMGVAICAQAVPITNGLPASTVGYWEVDVTDGGESRDAKLTSVTSGGVAEDIVFDFFSYVDVGTGGVRLSDPTKYPQTDFTLADQVGSSGQFLGSTGNLIDWTAVSTIPPGSPMMLNLLTFNAASGKLGKLRFSQYLDADVPPNVGDDVFFTRGSASGLNLELYTVDDSEPYGASQGGSYSLSQGLVNTSFAGWAACEYDELKSAIVNGTQLVSPQGVICPTLDAKTINHPIVGPAHGPADVTSVLTWDVSPSAKTATIVTTLIGVPDTPPLSSWSNLKQANFVSYFAPASKSDSLTLSGYLPSLDTPSQGPDSYCDKKQVDIDIWLYANGQWVQANVPGSLTATMKVPYTGPYTKCRTLSRVPGIKNLVFEVIQLRAEKHVYMTLEVNNKFDWDAAVDANLPAPPPRGSLYPMLVQMQVTDLITLNTQPFSGVTTLKVCDYNSKKVKLCAGPFQY
jgi:hypothetical protein